MPRRFLVAIGSFDGRMEDQDAVAEICFYTDVPDLEMSYSLLMLGKSRLSAKTHNGNGDGVSRFEGNDLLLRVSCSVSHAWIDREINVVNQWEKNRLICGSKQSLSGVELL